MRNTRQRIAFALGVSALLHAWILHDVHGLRLNNGLRLVAASGAPLTAILKAPPIDLLSPDIAPQVQPAQTSTLAMGKPGDRRAAMPVVPVAPNMPEFSAAKLALNAANGGAPLPQLSDPTFYGALSLDVYPKALSTLDLAGSVAVSGNAAGQVRATVLIDEMGSVNDVRAIDAATQELASEARRLLLQTRFTPARKEGRIVKAEVRVNLDYGSR